MEYNKLVRDKIPEIIMNQQEVPVTCVLNDEEFNCELKKKLVEEVNEYLESEEVEELTDIMEVLYALAKTKGYSETELENLRIKKCNERGKFDEKIFLIKKK
ncbi:nucleoside triphosphate pyrophosphohydrolase [Anaerorhabdus sp.]|uniref:Phosphoribosyl-ATP pyrophosphohydrolase n=1 Tax=bioreactor metagenome TaxID=1076179 RepID=A0A645GFY9_9ZZZZ|nr:nucleoside triphosphate pyrophosphohydrolase [Anaerorhabdus sp.]MEA4876118.1 nucleoside triphosphate pyrophosphohydrolase [Anaerorhabdus sp.]